MEQFSPILAVVSLLAAPVPALPGLAIFIRSPIKSRKDKYEDSTAGRWLLIIEMEIYYLLQPGVKYLRIH